MTNEDNRDAAPHNHNKQKERPGGGIPEKNGIWKKVKRFFSEMPEAWKQALWIYLAVRLMASLAAAIGSSAMPHNPIVIPPGYIKPHYSNIFEIFVGLWERADALWYIRLSHLGYDPGPKATGAVFFPLYPILIRVLHTLSGLPNILCALIISNAVLIIGLQFLYRLTEEIWGRETARRTLWYQALFPGSVFLFAPYTESLFLALATGSLYYARKNRWFAASVMGSFLSLTRNLGILILIPLLIEFIQQRRKEKIPIKKALYLLITPLGLGLLMLFWAKHAGDPLIFVHQQSGWQRQYMFPLLTYFKGLQQAGTFCFGYPGAIYILEAGAVTLVLIMGIFAIFKLPAPFSSLIWLLMLPPLTAPFTGNMLMSCHRFMAVIFPAFIMLAILAKNEKIDQGIRVIFAGLFGLSAALFVCSQWMF